MVGTLVVPAAIDTFDALIWAAVLFATAGTGLFNVPFVVVTVQLVSVTPVAGNPGVSVSVYDPAAPPVFDTVSV